LNGELYEELYAGLCDKVLSSPQVQSEKVWRQADRYGIRRLVFVNKVRKGPCYIEPLIQLLIQLPIQIRTERPSDRESY
jgi:hypothetical protein